MKLISVYFVSCCFWMKILGVCTTSNQYDGLIKYLKEESKLHQVVFIRDKELNNTDPVMNSVMKAVNTNFPSLSVTYNTDTYMWVKRHMELIHNSRHKTLFVLYCENIQNCITMMKIITGYSPAVAFGRESPSRFLFINSLPSTPDDLNTTLQTLWRSKYLDVTLLSYTQQQQQQVMILNTSRTEKVPFISKINPFSKEFFFENSSSKSQWFPNKLRDLHGYELNFCSSTKGSIKLNNEVKFGKLLAQAMNAKFVFQSCRDLFYARGSVDLYLMNEETNLPHSQLSFVRVLEINSDQFVIPKKFKYADSLTVSTDLLYVLLGTLGIIVIIRFAAFLLRFERSTWQTFNISQIIIGMATTREPEKFSGRLVFGSLLIVCVFYTGYFYTVILDITWQSEPEISNLEELANSTLIPMMKLSVKEELMRSYLPHMKKLGKKALGNNKRVYLKNPGSWEAKCWKNLVNHQNVTCVIPNAEYIVNKKAAEFELNLMVLPEAATYVISSWTSGEYCSYTDRFSELILRASEFGLLQDFYPPKVQVQNISPSTKTKKNKLFFILIPVFAVGYSLSIIVFLIEILTARFGSRMWTLYTRFKCEN